MGRFRISFVANLNYSGISFMELGLIKMLFLVLGVISTFGLAFLVYRSDSKGAQNKLFLVMSTLGAIWLVMAYLAGSDINQKGMARIFLH